jgi:hypothetical protein
MACPIIVDLRNIYRPEDIAKHGFAYACVGRSFTGHMFKPGPSIEQLMTASRVRANAPHL